MDFLEDILRVMRVNGREVEDIRDDVQTLAASRGARQLVAQLPEHVREELRRNIEGILPQEQFEIIQEIIRGHFTAEERQHAYQQTLLEVIEREFLPAILQEATEAQRSEIQKIMVGE